MLPSIEFLGYVIDENGRHPTPKKVQVIQEAPTPNSLFGGEGGGVGHGEGDPPPATVQHESF